MWGLVWTLHQVVTAHDLKTFIKYLSLESVSTWSKQIFYYSIQEIIQFFIKIEIIIFHGLLKNPFVIMPILITFLVVSYIYIWIIIRFNKKHHYLESLSHLLVAQNIYKAFFL
jgi:hypothetical protein